VEKLIALGGDINARNLDGATPFHFACRYLKCSEENITLQILVKLASATNFDILDREKSESTGLHLAAARGNLTTVKFILNHPSFKRSRSDNIESKDELGNTPLLKAALEGKAEVVQYLLDVGASLNSICNAGQNAIHKAALNGFVEVVKVIKAQDPPSFKRLVQQKDIGKSTVLHLSVYGGSLEIVELLQQDGFVKTQIQETNESLETPLHRAARRNFTSIINIFLDEGANINALNSKNQSPLHVASENGHEEAVKALIIDKISLTPRAETDLNIKDNFHQTPIIAALIKGDEAVFNLLIESGAHIDVKNTKGQNVLHILVEHDKLKVLDDVLSKVKKDEVLKLLSDNDFKEQNALHIAARVGNLTKVGEILLEKSISKDEFANLLKVKNDDDESPFHIATKQGNQELMNEIVKSYPEAVYQLAKDGNTASHLAAKHNQPECLKMLLNRSFELSPFNARYRTPLDCAAVSGSLACVRILLNSGYTLSKSSSNSKNQKFFSNNPLHLSAMNGHCEIVKLLIEEGADISSKDMDEKTPLQIALEKGHKSVVKVIITSSVWEQALRTAYHSDDKSMITPMRALIQNYPDLAELVLDKLSTEIDGDMLFNIEFFEDSFLKKPNTKSKDKYDFIDVDKNLFIDEDKALEMKHPMLLMLENHEDEEQVKLLKHPLIIALTRFKWNSYRSTLFKLEALVFVLYLSAFTAYSFITLNHEKDVNSSEIAIREHCEHKDKRILLKLILNSLFVISIICIGLCAIFELSKIHCKRYLITTFLFKMLLYCSVMGWLLFYKEVILHYYLIMMEERYT
jgi:ankyrin repeat protein